MNGARLAALIAAGPFVVNLASAQLRPQPSPPGGRTDGTEGSPPGATRSAIDTFVLRARSATRDYRDPRAAIRAGYRPIGQETPGMGQHWVSSAILFRARFDAGQPAGLQYATIAGTLTLVGVSYLVPLFGADTAPAFPSRHVWHAHAGTIDEESLVPEHDSPTVQAGPRVAVMHAWVWADNQAGMFAPENWSLPYQRASLAPPDLANHLVPVARAIALATGHGPYFTGLALRHSRATATDSARIRTAMDSAATLGAAILVRGRSEATAVDEQGRPVLGQNIWRELSTVWEDLGRRVGPHLSDNGVARLSSLWLSPP